MAGEPMPDQQSKNGADRDLALRTLRDLAENGSNEGIRLSAAIELLMHS